MIASFKNKVIYWIKGLILNIILYIYFDILGKLWLLDMKKNIGGYPSNIKYAFMMTKTSKN